MQATFYCTRLEKVVHWGIPVLKTINDHLLHLHFWKLRTSVVQSLCISEVSIQIIYTISNYLKLVFTYFFFTLQ